MLWVLPGTTPCSHDGRVWPFAWTCGTSCRGCPGVAPVSLTPCSWPSCLSASLSGMQRTMSTLFGPRGARWWQLACRIPRRALCVRPSPRRSWPGTVRGEPGGRGSDRTYRGTPGQLVHHIQLPWCACPTGGRHGDMGGAAAPCPVSPRFTQCDAVCHHW